jgi:hypothetical protein
MADTRTMHNLGLLETLAHMAPIHERPISHTDENWAALPKRLRGRGDFHRNNGRIKDAELMYDAATEIELLRGSKQ